MPVGQGGRRAEDLVEHHLRKEGYKILERNLVIRNVGELDIVAEGDGVICFVEVRSRRTKTFGDPAETVGPTKQERLRRLAATYLDKLGPGKAARFDVASVVFSPDGSYQLDYLRDAFE